MNGILVIDKPKGKTSHSVVRDIKKILKPRRAGHTGTLDPFATGVLPVCLDDATKVIPFLDETYKEYEAILKLGVTTDTLDETGEITNIEEVRETSLDEIQIVFSNIKNKTTQIPPMYSALKHKGRRLYELARNGLEVQRSPRMIKIANLKILDFQSPFLRFFVKCSRGTYVRVLASDIGDKLGYGGHLVDLRRLKSGNFKIEDTITMKEIMWRKINLIPIGRALSHLKQIYVTKNASNRIRNGQQIRKSYLDLSNIPEFEAGERLAVYEHINLVSLSQARFNSYELNKIEDRQIIFRHLRVFN
ncbi:MAG: tRNA pseudouridine(55) synthase TruB [Deltaproteobacteria bacterium]|nr:tRNA pseudouridine(55) synthase TruB [Deltaproteobacteria bacterium]